MCLYRVIYNLDSTLSFEFNFDHHWLISIAKEHDQGQVRLSMSFWQIYQREGRDLERERERDQMRETK